MYRLWKQLNYVRSLINGEVLYEIYQKRHYWQVNPKNRRACHQSRKLPIDAQTETFADGLPVVGLPKKIQYRSVLEPDPVNLFPAFTVV